MADLWSQKRDAAARAVEPLAVRMRPRTLEEFAGQEHILGSGKLLRRMLVADTITSIILHGPPGTGKTTLAEVIAAHTNRHFERENASSVGVGRIREIINEAKERLANSGRRTVFFLDEIHRFTRAQQDVLLNDVERGVLTLIGATTENPLFAVNSALVSRSTLFRLEPLSNEAIQGVLRAAIADQDRGYGKLDLRVSDEAMEVWAIKCDGDARRALTALEVAVLSSLAEPHAQARGSLDAPDEPPIPAPSHASVTPPRDTTKRTDGSPIVSLPRDQHPPPRRTTPATPELARGAPSHAIVIDRAAAEESIQQNAAVYDITGDEHYDSISAMIKSVRGSDPDAALYWIARMLEGGEDPRFIARRLAILASEDIGNADPRAIMVAAACWELVERIGLPECRLTLSQTAIYLALAPKSNAATTAIAAAIADVKEGRTLPVPIYLRDPNSSPIARGDADATGAAVRVKQSGGGKYVYSHDVEGGITGQDYLGVEKEYYKPTESGAEKMLAQRLAEIRKAREQGRST